MLSWKQHPSTDPETISDILSQNLWFNRLIIIDKSTVNFTKFSQKNIDFVDQLVNESCQFKKWQTLKDEYHLDNGMYFQWAQLIHAIPQILKNKIKQNLTKNESNLLVLNYLCSKLYIFGKIDYPLCFNCHSNDETVAHLCCEFIRVRQLWSQLRILFSTDLNLPLLTPQTAIFGFLVKTDKCIFKITNHLLLIFKMYRYI